jgi:hypothetical protein
MRTMLAALITLATLAGAGAGTRVYPDFYMPDQGPTSPGPTNPNGPSG